MEQNCREPILNEDYADFIIEDPNLFVDLLNSSEICYTPIRYGFILAHVPTRILPANFIHLYEYGIYPHCLGLLDIGSLEASNVTTLQNIPGNELRGQGVLIGIIDTGIDYTHPAFLKEDSTSKIISIWDQTNQSGSPPIGFSFGSEYKQSEINEALLRDDPLSLVPSFDEYGHGTFLAGISAGTRSVKDNFSGVVPDAEIIVVKLKPAKPYIRNFWLIADDKLCYQSSDIMLGIEYLRSIASSLDRPLSICIALGTSQSSHDGNDTLSRYLSITSIESGMAVVIAAGNEGTSGHHYFGELKNSRQSKTVELYVAPNQYGFTMELWGQAPNILSLAIQSPSGESIPRIPARLGESRVVSFLFDETVLNVDYFLGETQSGDQLILLRFQNPSEGIWRLQIYASQNYIAKFHIWLPLSNFIGEQTYFTNPDPETTLTTPANTSRPIVTTAYDHTNQSLYLSTSRGFTRKNVNSPDIAAPGVNLVAPSLNNSYSLVTGTSVAAAHTTGVAAMFLEWGILRKNYIQLDSVQISILFKRGATRFPTISYPDPAWGYGTLDLYGAIISLREGPRL